MAQDVLRAVEAGVEARQRAETSGAALGRGRFGQAQCGDCVVRVWHEWSGEGSERSYKEGEAVLDGGSGGFNGALAATFSAVRKLVGRKKRPFRPPVPMLGDHGKPLTSLQAKANQHQREVMKDFGENCAEFSEAEHLVKVQAPGPSVTPDESASATAGSTPLRPRFDLPRLQGGFRVEAEGHPASGGESEAVLPTRWTARTGDSASGKDAVVWRGRQC